MNDRRRQGLEKEISRIIGSALLIDVKNEKIRRLVTIKETVLSKDGKYVDANNDGKTNVGDKINYTFVVSNTGNVTL